MTIPRPGRPVAHARAAWAAWWMPDLAVALALFTVLYAHVLYRAPEQLFRDSDAGWHIRTGERILERASVPRVDEYSFAKPGAPWFAWEWGSDLLMGAAHRALGLRGVVLLFLALIALCGWLWMRLQWAAGANFWMACLLAAPMLTGAQLHWLARPHVFGWVLLLLSLLLLERRQMRWTFAALLGAVWANLHGSFFLLPVLIVIYNAGWRSAAAAALASFCNPYGWDLHRHLLRYLTDNELLSRVAEFQSFNFHTEGAAQIAFALLFAMAGAVCALALGQWSRALALILFCAMGLRSARGLPLLCLAALPLAGGAVTQALRLWPLLPGRLRSALDYGDRLHTLQSGLHGTLLAIPCLALVALAVIGTPAGFPASEFPVAAAEHVPAQARLLAPDKFGGYLIYRFDGSRKVYFDGRSDYYGAAFLKEYISLIEVRPGWESVIDKYQFTHALLPPRYSLSTALVKAGWNEIYRDPTAVLLQRNF